MSEKLTAVVKAYKLPQANGHTTLNFSPDYSSEENKKWAEYTPSLNFSMYVKDEVADKVENGQAFLVTFEPREN